MISASFPPAHLGQTQALALLIDPDKERLTQLERILTYDKNLHPDFFLIGGSLLWENRLNETLSFLRRHTDRPLVLFPGNMAQISPLADAVLFLSLISGRNPEFLIGQHVLAAPRVRAAGLKAVPTGYLLIEGGRQTAVHYLTQTQPLPRDKPELAAATALAGELLGQQLMYLEAGSGARQHVPEEMVKKVRETIRVPLIVGGGVREPETAKALWQSGANVVVVGSALEENPNLLPSFIAARQQADKG